MGRLTGKIAFVTGGARGIGRAIVDKFAAEGASVVFVDVDDARGRETARELSAAGLPAVFRRADVTVEADVRDAVADVLARHGTLDVLVNNAGINAYFDATDMTGLTRSLALEYAPMGIRVNAVLPGYTRTRLVDEWFSKQPDPAEAERRVLALHPLRRIATPEEIANLVAFAASDEASAITGASLAADCGLGIMYAS